MGTTRCTVENLQPLEEREVVLQAGFFAPGVYNVNKFKFLVSSSPPGNNNQSTPGTLTLPCPFQHLIRVQEPNES